jgi:tRNA nucleotidyltransferase (CCA-adding enzyme)
MILNIDQIECYLVGGAVRDALLGRTVKDRDWVVIGQTPESMLAMGFTQVGADFPVFLHPHSKEEYALARTERKSGAGYRGFDFQADANVTLEQDLARRDLRINAIAQDRNGQLIDPYGGKADLDAGVLRHVSPAFVEDPVRVLRVARFAARFVGFRIAPETLALMQDIVVRGECAHLVPERVFEELKKALQEPKPSLFLRALRATGALKVILPELDALYGVPQRVEFHPEVDTGVHQEMVSDAASAIAPGDTLVGFCALLHDLGKACTESEHWPKHVQHEMRGVQPVQALCARLRVPAEYAAMAEHMCREHLQVHMLLQARPATIVDLLSRLDAWRKPDRVRVLALCCEADKQGRMGLSHTPYPQAALLKGALKAGLQVNAESFVAQGLQGPQIGAAVRQARCEAVSEFARAFIAGLGF